MARDARKVLAYNCGTGEKREFRRVGDCARALGVTDRSVIQAMEGGYILCTEWRVYDAPERIKAQIEVLDKRLKIVENL